jgi:CRISPR/Cas system CSM-associated protein Csm3 (group 7 of RAMP superfamily)
MKNRIKLTLNPESSFLLGGVSINPAYDSVTALDENNLPYLTATAVKGALRLDFEAFTRGIGEEVLCDLDADIRGCGTCLACCLFGGGNEEGKLRFNAALLEKPHDTLPENIRGELLEKGRREGVAISRTLGKAREKSYFSTRPFPNLKNIREITFETWIDIREKPNDKEYDYLEMFFDFIGKTGIFMGSRKSTGLGYFKIEAVLPGAYVPPAPVDTADKKLKLYKITLNTLEPLLLGNTKNRYVIDTLPYIPASTLGGTIGFKLSEYGLAHEAEAMFDKKNSFSTFNLYPGGPFPAPASMRQKKGAEKEKKDILLTDYLIKKALEDGKFGKVTGLFDVLYKNNLRPVPLCEKPHTIYNTKIAIGRELQKSSEGLLYSMELIPGGSEFSGFVIGESWAAETLNNINELCMGGKRTRGFGRTKIELKAAGINELLDPEQTVDSMLREIAGEYSIAVPRDRRFFSLDLLSDFALPHTIPEGERSFKKFLKESLFSGLDVSIEKSFLTLVRRGGYDFRKKRVKPMMERIGAGSTLLLSVPLNRGDDFLNNLKSMVDGSVNYKWDLTPLFRLDSREHIENIWR